MATPTGTMKIAHTPISQIVPQKAAWIPDWSALIEEKLVMKSMVSVPAPSMAMSISSTASSSTARPMPNSIAAPEEQVLGARAGRRPADGLGRGHYSYTCLYLRTKRIEIRFITSVIKKSVKPTAKIVL